MATWSVMADVPNPIIVDAAGTAGSGYVLKAYLPGGTTSTSIAIDSAGSSPQASITANANGAWEVTGNEILPYIDRTHKWGIFANAVDAAANTPFYLGPFDNVEQAVNPGNANNDLRYGPVFATVAAFVAANPVSIDGNVVVLVAGMTVYLQGWTTAGDGGDKELFIVASQAADEFGDHTAANGTVGVLQKEQGSIHSYQFGVGTGSDDTTAYQAFLDYPCSIKKTGPLLSLASTVNFNGTGSDFFFEDTILTILAGGTFSDIITFGSGADTGQDVVLSIADTIDGCIRCTFDGSIKASDSSSGHTGLVLFAAKTLTQAFLNQFPIVMEVSGTAFDFAVYGQGNTVSVAGSFTGTKFAFIETGDGVGAFHIDINQDDVTMGVIRDRGKSILNSELTVESYFMRGTDATNNTDGVVIGGFGSLKVIHHFVEGDFDRAVLLNGASSNYSARIRVSSNFTSTDDYVVLCNQDDCSVDIEEEPQSRQGSHTGYVSRIGTGSQTGRFSFKLSADEAAPSFKIPILYSGSTNDDVITVTTGDKDYVGRNIDGALRQYASTPEQRAIFQQAVVNGGRYHLGITEGSNIIELDSATNVQVFLNPSKKPTGQIVLMASGAGTVQVVSDGTTPINYKGGVTNIFLAASRGSAFTLVWNDTVSEWFQVGEHITYS